MASCSVCNDGTCLTPTHCAHLREMKRQFDVLQERIATVHERQRCPRCDAPVGERCRSMPRGWRPLDTPGRVRVLSSPHKQRLRADGIYER